jgi:hypothetical protein
MRGALLIGVAVVIGLVLLAQGFKDDSTTATSHPATTVRSGTTVPGATASTVLQAHDPAQVKVLVLNASGKSGVAKAASDELKAVNYTLLDAGNAAGAPLDASIVYFVAGFEADAQTIAAKLGLVPSAVQALPTPPPSSITDPKDANVIVLVGTDAPVAGGAGAGTTASTAPTTTAN